MRHSLDSIHEVAAGEAASGRATSTVGVVNLLREKILNSNLGLRHRELSLATVWPAENVGERHAVAALGVVLLQNRGKGRGLQMRLHRSQSWCGVVLQRQVAQAGQLIAGEGAKTRRVRRCGDWCVVRSWGKRIMGKGGRRRRGGVGRVGTGALDMANSTVVVVVTVILARVASRHVVGAQPSRVTARVNPVVAVVGVMTRGVAVAQVLALDLVGSLGKHGNVTTAVVMVSAVGRGKGSKRVRRGDVG